VFGIFTAVAGLSSVQARSRNAGQPFTMTPAMLRLAQAAMAKHDTKVGDLCKELGVYRSRMPELPATETKWSME
jgi:hypothetical protein